MQKKLSVAIMFLANFFKRSARVSVTAKENFFGQNIGVVTV